MEAVECILGGLFTVGVYFFGYWVRGQQSGYSDGNYTEDPRDVHVVTPDQARRIQERLDYVNVSPIEWQKALEDAGVVVFVRKSQ